MNANTAPLLDQARAGDRSALGHLLESYRGYLTVLAGVQIGRRLQGKVDAADVAQEAFLGAARDFGQFRGVSEAEFIGWLRQVLASVLANLVRHYQGTKRRDVRLERSLNVELDQSSQALDRGLGVVYEAEQVSRCLDSIHCSRLESAGRGMLKAKSLQNWYDIIAKSRPDVTGVRNT